LLASPEPNSADIRKFEHLGTRSFAIEQAIAQAIDFHSMIGIQRKQARLHFLKNYWAEKVCEFPGVSVGTSMKPEFGCALGLLKVEGKDPADISEYLFDKHRIHTVSIKWENIEGVRITPNVYTLTADLDMLVDAVAAYLKT
jgi:selenocysteine lyase/cysteine desulfurase